MFVPYFMLVLDKKLQGTHMQRNEREARTLCELLDALLEGRTMQAIMLALGRLKAVEASLSPESGGWSTARQLELAARPGQGLVSSRDRQLASRDTRDEARGLARPGRGGGRQH